MVRQAFFPVNGKHACKLPLMGKSMQSKVLTGNRDVLPGGERMAKPMSVKLSVYRLISQQTPCIGWFSLGFNLISTTHLAPQMR